MNRILDKITNHYRVTLIIIMLLSLPMAWYYGHQKYFNNIDIYFDKSDPDLQFYKQFQETYGNEELAVIAFKHEKLFSKKILLTIDAISTALINEQGVQRLFSLTEAKEAVDTNNTISFQKIIQNKDLSPEGIPGIKNKIMNDPLLVNSMVSKKGTTSAILIELEPVTSNNEKRDILIHLKSVAEEIAGDTLQLRFAGQPFLEVEMNDLTRRDNLKFTPVLLLVIFLILTFLIRKASLAFLTMISLLTTVVWGIGLLTANGETLNMSTVIIPPVLLAISVADSIHLLSHYRETFLTNGNRHGEAVLTALKAVWLPCFFTSVTTGIGFFSFITATIRPPKIVGIFTSIGVMVAFFLTITMLPSFLMLMSKRLSKKEETKDSLKPVLSENTGVIYKYLSRTGEITTTHYRPILIAFIILTTLTIWGMSRLRFETNFASYMPEHIQLKKDILFIDENLGGTIPFVMLIQAKDANHDFTHPDSLKLLSKIQKDLLHDMDHFSSAFSLADYFKEIHQAFNKGKQAWYRIPEKRMDILDYYEVGESDVLDRVVAPDRLEARISFQSHWGSNQLAEKYEIMVKKYMSETLGEHFTYKFTGLSPLYLTMGENLQNSQIRSFLVAFAIILVMMYFVCRSIPLTIISMIPNLFPIMMTMGVMGWFNIPLDVATIMIASVVIGIAVDDTIHFITWYRRNITGGMGNREALQKAFQDVGKPIIITSLVLSCGFLVLILGTVRPTQTFGALTAFSMLAALIGDLLILPAIIRYFNPLKAPE